MNIAIVGAGAVGIATAYALALDGHTVTVYETHRSAAEEASFAPAGWLTPALFSPWAAPGLASRQRSISQPGRQALLRWGASISRQDLSWLLQWRRTGKQIRKTALPEKSSPTSPAAMTAAPAPATEATAPTSDAAMPPLEQAAAAQTAPHPSNPPAQPHSSVQSQSPDLSPYQPAPGAEADAATPEAAPQPAIAEPATASRVPNNPVWAALQLIEELAQYSAHLRQQNWLRWEYDPESVKGSLLLMSNATEMATLQPLLAVLEQAGLTIEQLDAAATRKVEPGLNENIPLAGALRLPQGHAANGRLSAQVQRHIAQQLGVQFVHGQTVSRLIPAAAGQKAQLMLSGQGQSSSHSCDAIIVCAGTRADALLHPLGTHLPCVELGGYTVNAPLRDETRVPRHAIVDWQEQLTIVPQGLRVRLGAGAELGTNKKLHQATLTRMYHRLNALYPGGCQLDGAVQVWRGTRVCTPDGLPIVGASRHSGIWLNLAHGACGNAMAEGCAQILADQLANRPPEVNAQALAPGRFA